MTEPIPPQTPLELWRKLCFHQINRDQIQETQRMLSEDPDFGDMSNEEDSVRLATRLRVYNFGDLTTPEGELFERKKTSLTWLVAETVCLLPLIEQEAERTVPLN